MRASLRGIEDGVVRGHVTPNACRYLNPRFGCYMAPCDADVLASPPPDTSSTRNFNPRFSIHVAFYDVASTICRVRPCVGCRWRRGPARRRGFSSPLIDHELYTSARKMAARCPGCRIHFAIAPRTHQNRTDSDSRTHVHVQYPESTEYYKSVTKCNAQNKLGFLGNRRGK